MVDTEALAEAFEEVAKKKLMKEVHEWIIYTAPLGVHEVYRTYLDIVEKKQQEELSNGN